jgi:putative tricarboxylic transport membrane protein
MNDRTNPRLKLNNSELWGGLIGLALGIFVIRSGIKLKLGTINDPGSGYVLFYTGILMCLFAAAIIIAAVTEGGPTFGSRWEGARWTKPAVLIACLVVYCFALEPLGFLVSSIPLMLLLLRAIDPVRWPLAIPLAVLAPLGVWWVLKRVLLIQLPAGIFDLG